LKIDRLAALFGTIFFAVHPTATESVSMIVCRNNLLVTIFSISSLIFYIESHLDRWLLLFISAVFFCFALLSKEVAVMMIPVFFYTTNQLVLKTAVFPKRL
jgi:predicted membrane-bound mannosyltransferase